MDLKLSDDALNTLVSKAILDQLSAEGRDKVIKEAIIYLTTVKKEKYGTRTISPLQAALSDRVEQAAHRVIEDYLKEDPTFKATVLAALHKAMEMLTTDKDAMDALAKTLSAALGETLAKGRY